MGREREDLGNAIYEVTDLTKTGKRQGTIKD